MHLTDLESVQIDPSLDQTSKRESSSAKERSNLFTKNYRHFLHNRINKRTAARATIRYNACGSALIDIISRMRIFTLTVQCTNQRKNSVTRGKLLSGLHVQRAEITAARINGLNTSFYFHISSQFPADE